MLKSSVDVSEFKIQLQTKNCKSWIMNITWKATSLSFGGLNFCFRWR
jgi:hypothetical protein